jgi:hypothetical protein
MSTLPSHRAFVTQLLNSLSSLQHPNASAESGPLNDAPEAVKKQLISLQVLFPNEFLPALDLLDRKLVTRFVIGIEEAASSADDAPTANDDATASASDVQMLDNEPLNNNTNPTTPRTPSSNDTVHYVRSAQQRSSRFSTSYDSTITYEVRLAAWNCTCPAFAFAAFPAVHPEPPVPTFPSRPRCSVNEDEDVEAEKRKAAEWMFGGVSLGQEMPTVCKHLLACVLAERCRGVFGECVEEKRVSVETAAGWAAGWGNS